METNFVAIFFGARGDQGTGTLASDRGTWGPAQARRAPKIDDDFEDILPEGDEDLLPGSESEEDVPAPFFQSIHS